MLNKLLKNKPVWAMSKSMVSMATNVILNNWGEPTQSITSQLLLILDY